MFLLFAFYLLIFVFYIFLLHVLLLSIQKAEDARKSATDTKINDDCLFFCMQS
jgi:hypothetical protein